MQKSKFQIRIPYLAAGHDIAMAAISFILSLYLRLGDEFAYAEPSLLPGTVIFTLVCAVVFTLMRVYQGIWKYASIYDLIKITKSVTISLLIFIPIMFLYNRLEGMPRSVFVINWFVLLALLGGPRFLYRLLTRRTLLPDIRKVEKRKKIPVLLVGVNDHTEMFIRDVVGQPDSEYEVVGILDNDQSKIGQHIYNVRIFGSVGAIFRVVQKLKAKGNPPQKILFSPGFVEAKTIKQLLEHSDSLGLTIARIPKITELKSHIQDKREIQPIAIEDLLGRPQNALDRGGIKDFIKDKRVLVTGAGGTIGSELVRQIASYKPKEITLYEISEHSLYLIDKELEENFSSLTRRAVIGDVRSRKDLDIVFSGASPEIVFHAAALKHVPLSEVNAEEAVLTNVIGTRNVADACIEAGIKQMVMISTDKAVNPTSVMGATKRLAENYIQALGKSKDAGDTKFVTVRFGNVLGSAGSVVPLFRRQLESGGPLTVTDPKITRYFMTVREAVELVLQASVLGYTGEDGHGAIYVLNMGEPVLIRDLAYQMIRLAGLKPDEDIQVTYTGLRPGEKLYEELFYHDEFPKPTKYPDIMLAKSKKLSFKEIIRNLERLEKFASGKDTNKTLEALKEAVSEYR